MATANLCLHAGGVSVARNELQYIPCPEPTATWFPIRHDIVANKVTEVLSHGGYHVSRERWAVSGKGFEQMFGVLDLTCQLQGRDVTLAVGIRNSVNKTFPMGFCAGNRVFVCDNLAFSGELMVKRKHTRYGLQHFHSGIHRSVAALDGFVHTERLRIERWQGEKVSQSDRDEVILRALEAGIFPKTLLASVFREQVHPQYSEFADGTVFGMFNNFTTAMRERAFKNPNEHSRVTQVLTMLIDKTVFGIEPVREVVIDVTPEEGSAE